MKRKRQVYPAFHAGTSLLLVIFIILCLVVLASLSLSGALRDYSYAQKEADHTTAYYEADTKASRILSKLVDAASAALAVSSDPSPEVLQRSLAAIEGVEISAVEGSPSMLRASYTCPCGSRQELKVSVLFDTEGTLDRGNWQIEMWKTAFTADWEGNDSLPVLEMGD